MTVLDAFAVVAYLRDEPAAGQVGELLAAGDAQLTTVGLAEVVDHAMRLMQLDEEELALDLAELALASPITSDAAIGWEAGRLRARHHHRLTRAVSMADCVAASAAAHVGRPLATADPHLLQLCSEEGVATIALPASDGSVWTPSG